MHIHVADDLRVLNRLLPPDPVGVNEIIAAPTLIASTWCESRLMLVRTASRLFTFSPDAFASGGVNILFVDGEIYMSVG